MGQSTISPFWVIIRVAIELIGLVAVTQFIAAHLLLQQKRAELFARIVVLKRHTGAHIKNHVNRDCVL